MAPTTIHLYSLSSTFPKTNQNPQILITTNPPSKPPMADEQIDQSLPRPLPPPSLLAVEIWKRRTWVALFLLAYAFLISLSWNILLSIRSWYNNTITTTTEAESWWPAVYASVLYGVLFGVMSMAAALAVVVPATLVTWITVLVLLAFAGKPQSKLVMEGRKVTKDIAEIAFRILIREGNLVAGCCAVLSFFILLRRRSPANKEDLSY